MSEDFPICRRCCKNPVVLKDFVCSECARSLQAEIRAEISRQSMKRFVIQRAPGCLVIRLRCLGHLYVFYCSFFRAK
jgi:hypothetical protein